ncbi:DNRLRE domain-containing protein [Clostridium sp. 'White wine YQ']|uniref:DNRLRE domain-containing protein n=1 Tax=Clostridium sp. 'White wine YQ' TaxID=3027474 RepID=UPI00236537C3|nr:DNRLRE domain-containing protein [Clostridium sp. 'White wine YQ']MDD7795327.1 DNRLRE domain-containing protein [Clostridium sp. 'White wine YQ']
MPNLLIPATKSLTVTNRVPNGNINEDTILVGNDGEYIYISYLFFDISAIPKDSVICNVDLILFKSDNFYNSRTALFISPLKDFFSTYTTFNNRPEVNTVIRGTFYPLTSKVAITANLTYFVSYWLKNRMPNTCIALYSKESNIVCKFGSAISKDSYLITFLNVTISQASYSNKRNIIGCLSPTPNPQPHSLEYVDVTGEVAAQSVYASVVNVQVTRSGTGTKDNYYVSHIYDNSSSLSSLSVNATYTVAIVPPIQPGDTVEGTVFGSYKE